MMRRNRRTGWGIFPLAGWLFTDLLLAMMMIFLVSAKDGIPNIPPGRVTPTPTRPPVLCGVEKTSQLTLVTVSDPTGVRNETTSAMNSFFNDVRANKALKANAHRIAGVVEVFGGSPNVGDGIQFATGAIHALKLHSNGQFIFSSRTGYFKPLWDGTIRSNQVEIYIFYYILANSCGSQ